MFENVEKVKLDKQETEIRLPNAEQAAEALAGAHGEAAQELALRWLRNGAVAQYRNHHKAGRTLPDDWAAAVEADAAARASKGGSGEGLAHVRAMVQAFKAWLEQRGAPAKGVAVACKLASSPSALALAAPALRDKVVALLSEFAESEAGAEHADIVQARIEAASEGADELLDF